MNPPGPGLLPLGALIVIVTPNHEKFVRSNFFSEPGFVRVLRLLGVFYLNTPCAGALPPGILIILEVAEVFHLSEKIINSFTKICQRLVVDSSQYKLRPDWPVSPLLSTATTVTSQESRVNFVVAESVRLNANA